MAAGLAVAADLEQKPYAPLWLCGRTGITWFGAPAGLSAAIGVAMGVNASIGEVAITSWGAHKAART